MNLVDLPVSILLVAVIYLFSIYALLSVAPRFKQNKNTIVQNSSETGKQIEIP